MNCPAETSRWESGFSWMYMRATFSDGLNGAGAGKGRDAEDRWIRRGRWRRARSAGRPWRRRKCPRAPRPGEDETGVLLGKQALGDRHVEPAGQDGQRHGRRQGERLVSRAPRRGRDRSRAAWRRRRSRTAWSIRPRCFAGPLRCRKRAHITGVRVSETKADMTTAAVTVTANSRNSTPTMPPISSSGMNTATREMVIETMVKPISPSP